MFFVVFVVYSFRDLLWELLGLRCSSCVPTPDFVLICGSRFVLFVVCFLIMCVFDVCLLFMFGVVATFIAFGFVVYCRCYLAS